MENAERRPTRQRLADLGRLIILVVIAGMLGTGRAHTEKPAVRNPLNPESAGHFRVSNPANLGPGETTRIYDRLFEDMIAAYRLSGDPAAAEYGQWKRYNTAPYSSSEHGARFVNNYANPTAAAYGRFEEAGIFPAGSLVVKDSFSVDAEGDVRPGPLFIMEKMPAGFRRDTGDWRYAMVLPDGSLFGETKGENAENVEFCIACHAAVAERDHLFFLPEEYRVKR